MNKLSMLTLLISGLTCASLNASAADRTLSGARLVPYVVDLQFNRTEARVDLDANGAAASCAITRKEQQPSIQYTVHLPQKREDQLSNVVAPAITRICEEHAAALYQIIQLEVDPEANRSDVYYASLGLCTITPATPELRERYSSYSLVAGKFNRRDILPDGDNCLVTR
jgi:hypothetical protein